MQTSRAYAGEADLPHIAELLRLHAAAEGSSSDAKSVDVLRHDLDDPWIDKARNLRLWEQGERLVGFGWLYTFEPTDEVQGRLLFYIHPEADGDHLGAQILDWAAGRLREHAAGHDLPIKLRVAVRESDTLRVRVLRAGGLSIERYALDMERPLSEPLPEAALPLGFTLRSASADDAAAWTAMYNESFVDHWNFRAWTPDRFLHWFNDPDNDPSMCLVAVAPDTTFAAFCWATIYAEDNARSGRSDGHIDLLGTRRGFRRVGLGRALLLAGMRRLAARGMTTVKLDVDASSPTGADRLYVALGFHTTHTWARYVKDVAGNW